MLNNHKVTGSGIVTHGGEMAEFEVLDAHVTGGEGFAMPEDGVDGELTGKALLNFGNGVAGGKKDKPKKKKGPPRSTVKLHASQYHRLRKEAKKQGANEEQYIAAYKAKVESGEVKKKSRRGGKKSKAKRESAEAEAAAETSAASGDAPKKAPKKTKAVKKSLNALASSGGVVTNPDAAAAKKAAKQKAYEVKKAAKVAKKEAAAAAAAAAAEEVEKAEEAEKAEASSSCTVEDLAIGWGAYELHPQLMEGLAKCGFKTPTPVQEGVISQATRAKTDILASAQTGSGKTLAFGLPILSELLEIKDRIIDAGIEGLPMVPKDSDRASRLDPRQGPWRTGGGRIILDAGCPIALVLLPTRELALQVEEHMKAVLIDKKVTVAVIVGGINEQKQGRVLNSHPDVVIATPGRLNALMQEHPYLANLHRVRFLVMDEADRMVEHAQFSDIEPVMTAMARRIKASRVPNFMLSGDEPNAKREISPEDSDVDEEDENMDPTLDTKMAVKLGDEVFYMEVESDVEGSEDEVEGSEDEEEMDLEGVDLSTIDIEELDEDQLEAEAAGVEPENGPNELEKALMLGGAVEDLQQAAVRTEYSQVHKRQTFIISATLSMSESQRRRVGGRKFVRKEKPSVKELALIKSGVPAGLAELIAGVPFQRKVKTLDYGQKFLVAETIKQTRIQLPGDERDAVLTYLLTMYPGRTLVFVNTVSMLRRLAPLLTHLHKSVHPIHASMQQRARMKSLERFKANPNSVLIATDVAARGLDIPNVDTVIHYSVPHKADTYVHRSGRAGRAGRSGTSILFVAPTDLHAYRKLNAIIMESAGDEYEASELPTFPVDEAYMKDVTKRVKAARKIEGMLHDTRKKSVEKEWFLNTAKAMDVVLEDDVLLALGAKEEEASVTEARAKARRKKALNGAKATLATLLKKPLMPYGSQGSYTTNKRLLAEALRDRESGNTRSTIADSREGKVNSEIPTVDPYAGMSNRQMKKAKRKAARAAAFAGKTQK